MSLDQNEWGYTGVATGALWNGINRSPEDSHTRKAGEIISAILRVTCVTQAELFGPFRTRHVSEARQLAYFMLRHHTMLSLPRIGCMIGGKHHTSVLHGIRHVASHPRRFGKRLNEIAEALALPEVHGVHSWD